MTQSLSDHFSLAEAQVTSHRDIDNFVPFALIPVVMKTALGMEKVRLLLGGNPISINSWYRNPELNLRVGGSKNSQHMKGEAVDFICPKFGSPQEIVKELMQHSLLLRYDQLIYEHTWVHISWNSIPGAKQRNQVLTLLSKGGYATGLTDKQGKPL